MVPDEGGDTLSPAEAKAIAEADEWSKHNEPIPHEQVLAEFGLFHGGLGKDESRALMAKRVVWTDQAKADIRAIEQSLAIQILKTLGRYVLTGEGATKQLQGRYSAADPPPRPGPPRLLPRPRRIHQDRTRPRPQRRLSLRRVVE